jgi:acyl-CoA synthetase (NDP forming)
MTAARRPIYRHKDLRRLFNPRSIAVIGATTNPKAVASQTIAHFDNYDGKVFRINPRYEKIGEHPCYPSVRDLPEPADCVVICVPKDAVEAAVLDCAGANVGGVVVYASG